MAENWSESEVRQAVEDYFDMLRLELTGHKYNKTEHRQILRNQLNDRSNGSVELKHQNISAVLIEMGAPYIDGYKPRHNYQRSLVPAVSEFLADNPEYQLLFQTDAEVTPSVPTVMDFLAAMEAPPDSEDDGGRSRNANNGVIIPPGVNYLEREARNRSLGDAGEEFVINYERARLIHAGKEMLADQIDQVSVSVGPSAGFDIHSYEESGKDRFIEAKTTKYGKNTPFFVTPNELRFSRDNAGQYFLYRIFKFRAHPRLFALHGHLEERCNLTPSQYLARMA